ncbi:MAG: ATP-binding protein [Bacteroidales bacterium]|nr:ATP-binding protein [Bacteroidales bacterium]
MTKETILQQKYERDALLGKAYQPRLLDLPVSDYLQSSLIKLITGPRRAGKSVCALLILRDVNFAYLNFDDAQLLHQFNEDEVMQHLQEVYPNFQYLLLDEIQNLSGWELWVSKLYRRGINLVITGSNSKLLSSEMATTLTGRFLNIEILPFSLTEYLSYRNISQEDDTAAQKGKLLSAVDDYLHNGGFAETILTPSIIKTYLSSVYDSVLLKDIVNRFKIRRISELSNIASYLLANFTNPISFTNITQELGLPSKTTAQKFCGYLLQSYLFFFLPMYNNKLQLMQKAARKVYIVDNGLICAKAFQLSQNLGRLLENAVFIRLIQAGLNVEQSLFYYRSRNNKETDFVIRVGNKITELVQVCYDFSSPSVQKREVSAIVECAGELKCDNLTVVTWNEEQKIENNGLVINVMPFYKWKPIK